MRYFMALMLLFFTSPVSAKTTEHTLIHDNLDRRYLVYVPESMPTKNKPVVMVFHGGGGHAENSQYQTNMDAVADKYGFVVVYPEGIGSRIGNFHTWNVGRCCGRASNEQIDDIGFISRLIDVLAVDYQIDTSRVYATGHSNGGMISYLLACKLSEKIAAVAPNAGGYFFEDCSGKRKVPILHLHGTEDECANFKGSQECGGCFGEMFQAVLPFMPNIEKAKTCDPVPQMVDQWSDFNGCSDQKKLTFQKGAVTCSTYQDCQAPVTLCTFQGAGHTWPGGRGLKKCHDDPDSRICQKLYNIIGPTNRDINGSDFIWQFFKQHKL